MARILCELCARYVSRSTADFVLRSHLSIIAHHHLHHQRGTYSISKTITYDPDACASSWIAYVSKDIASIYAWRSRTSEIHYWTEAHPYREVPITVTASSTSLETIWTPLATQCDRLPRIASAGIRTHVLPFDDTSQTTIYDFPPPAPELPYPWENNLPPFPACEIRPSDCQRQWDTVQQAFTNSNHTFANLTFDHWPEDNPEGIMLNCMDFIWCSADKIPWNLDAWLLARYILPQNRGFFAGCPQLADVCMKPYAFMPDGYWLWDKGNSHCQISADRFVLIFFAPREAISKDFCGNETGVGLSNFTANDHSAVRTAILDEIVFGAKERQFGYDGRQNKWPDQAVHEIDDHRKDRGFHHAQPQQVDLHFPFGLLSL
jgi:hypothetical protein